MKPETKPYFAKYLPKPGGMQRVVKEGGVPVDFEREVQLFLCTIDIQVGDKIKCIRGISGKGDIGMSGHTYETSYLTVGQYYEVWMDDSDYWGVYSDDGAMNFPKEYFENFKPLGPISKQAGWVKENDAFTEKEVLVLEWGGSSIRKPIKQVDFSKLEIDDTYPKILIKGPCGHFH